MRPVVSPFADRVYEALGPHTEQDEALGWPLLLFTDALTRGAADVETFAGDQDGPDGSVTPGWVTLLDPDTCPAKGLPFLGQMVGVTVPIGTDEATARALIQAKGGWGRGTPAAIIAAAQMTLTGARSVFLTERDGSAYRIKVTTYTAETPSTSALQAAVLAALPAGLVATFVTIAGWTIDQMETEEAGQTVAYLESHWATVNDFESQLP